MKQLQSRAMQINPFTSLPLRRINRPGNRFSNFLWHISLLVILSKASRAYSAVPPPIDEHLNDFDRQFSYQIAIITAEDPLLIGKDRAQIATPLHKSPDYAELFVQSKRDWANYQGYDYIHTVIENEVINSLTVSKQSAVEGRNQSANGQLVPEPLLDWVKVDLLRQYLPRYDWICWMDMDSIVVDMQVELQQFIQQAIRRRPQLDLIIEGTADYRSGNGQALGTGVILLRNSVWSQRLLRRASDLLDDPEWPSLAQKVLIKRSLQSNLADALVMLLADDRQLKGSDSHVYLMKLQDWWDQNLLYLPRIGILHFRNCLDNDAQCLQVLKDALEHLLTREQLYIYQAAPYVQHVYNIFVVIYVLFSIDRLYHIIGRRLWRGKSADRLKVCLLTIAVKLFLNFEQLRSQLPSTTVLDSAGFPLVAVQLPMFNEKSCCQTIIDCACRLDWPKDRLLVQVVDDSTCLETRRLVDDRCGYWQRKGVMVEVCRRSHRLGFKAGAMNEAMERFSSQQVEFIAIFDADFLPQPQFLRQTVPYLMAQPDLAFVQTTWSYTNAKESLLTRMQEISLNFHFFCEQESRFRTCKFFNFNGTAGVWRKNAISDSGGWEMDTLVEDMDLSLRAWARGWQFLYLRDVCCDNEIPPTFDAYRSQQHRWTSGPMQVMKKAVRTVALSEHLSLTDKMFCLWFFMRNYVHVVNFLYFLILIPLMIWIPRVILYEWAVVYLPAAISISNILFTPSEWYHVLHYILFENAMCLYKTGALVSGIFNIGKAKHWTVTPKFARKTVAAPPPTAPLQSVDELILSYSSSSPGSSGRTSPAESPTPSKLMTSCSSAQTLPSLIEEDQDDYDCESAFTEPPSTTSLLPSTSPIRLIPIASAYFNNRTTRFRPRIRLHWPELFMATFLSICAYYGFLMNQNGIATFSMLNAIAYLILGCGMMGKIF